MARRSKRRGSGEGTISYRSKEGRYEGRYTVQTPKGPKRKVVYGKTFEETRIKLAKAISDRDADLLFDAEDLTVAEYLSRWIRGPAKKNVRLSTYARYEQCTRKHLIPALGRLQLKKLTALHLEDLYEKLEEELAPRTINYVHVTISKALKHAVRKELIRRNVAALAEAPRPDAPEVRPLESEQARAFLAAARGERMEALYVLALAVGMRRSELLGLKYEDLDLEAGTLSIRRGLTVAPKGGVILGEPKRPSSKRLIELPDSAVFALSAHRTRQKKERLAAGPRWKASGFVFTTLAGTHMHPNTLYRNHFLPLREKANVPPIHFHDLRHTYATLALKNGIPVRVVSDVLGHKDIATTLHTYAHVLPGMYKEAARTMDAVLF